jgi:hypothetical protein
LFPDIITDLENGKGVTLGEAIYINTRKKLISIQGEN